MLLVFVPVVLAVLGLAAWLLVPSAHRKSPSQPPVHLSEICVVNTVGPVDEDGDYSDWIEIYNAGAGAVSLEGWSLTDSPHHLRKWTFPATEIPGGGFLLVFASGKNRAVSGKPLHTGFRLSRKGEYLGLIPPDASAAVDEFLPRYPVQTAGATYGLGREFFDASKSQHEKGRPRPGYLAVATPGQINADRVDGFVSDVVFGVRRGFFQTPFELALDTATPGATIRYTTNGLLPTATNGLVYRKPILIRDTTPISAAAFLEGYAPSRPETHTFVFPGRVAAQTGAGWPATWGKTNDQPVAAYYPLAPDTANDTRYRSRLPQALEALPTLALTVAPDDLYGPDRGIYSHPRETGREWERRAFVEWIDPAGNPGFAIPCAIRVQGGWSRRPEESPKHSFRLLFKKPYGPTTLDFPVYGDEKPVRFETLVLRGANNNGWLHWSGEERHRGEYLRDQWIRDSFREMGQISARGRFVHVYLDGLYWGVYNLAERPDAAFVASHWGGQPADYDSIKAGKARSGDLEAWHDILARLNAGVTNNAVYEDLARRVDLTNVVDFLILNFYGANDDWDRVSNWYAARRRTPEGQLHFLVWDAERSLEKVDDNRMAFDDDECPPRFFQKLRNHPEFRMLFADRVHQHFSAGGVLAPASAAARYRRLAAQLEPAILGESARWGDYRRQIHPYKTPPFERYTPDDHWRPEVQRLLTQYFPARTTLALEQFKQAGLYPPVAAPVPRHTDGRLRFDTDGAAIYHTLDRSDPRQFGGDLAPAARPWNGDLTLAAGSVVRARARRDSPNGPVWSPLVEFECP